MREMKDSGIEWIGEIPKGYSTLKIKYCCNLKGRIGWQGLTSAEYAYEGAYLITGTDFNNGKIDWNTCVKISEERFQEAPEIHIKENDILITKDGTIGKVAIATDVPGKVSLNSGVLLIRFKENSLYSNKYLYYVLTSEIFWNWFKGTKTGNSTIQHLYQEKFKEFSYPNCNIEEQTTIANYLDYKCGKIDVTIQREKQHIEKLKEYRQSVITEAVTKGLDPTAPMKDSSIEWIGEVPQEWKVLKLKYISKIKSGDGITSSDQEDNGIYEIWGGNGLNGFTSNFNVDSNNLVIGRVGALCGNVRLSIGKRFVSDNALILNLTKDDNYYYFAYLILSANLGNMNSSNAQPLITGTKVVNLQIPLPPLPEQTVIADYLDRKTTQIDSAIAKKETLIEKLTEYKKSMIYEAVTGKVEVS